MSVALKTDEQLLLRRDEAGVAWLTMNRPAARNALSVGLMGALEAELDAIAAEPAVHVVVIGGAGPAFCAGHDLREMRANPGARGLRGAVRAMLAADAADRAAAQAGDRARARRRHRRRLPARRELRSGGRRRQRALRHAGREYRPVLLDADGGAVPRGRAQAGDGDAADRRADRRRAGARDRAGQPRRARGRARCGGGRAGRGRSRRKAR